MVSPTDSPLHLTDGAEVASVASLSSRRLPELGPAGSREANGKRSEQRLSGGNFRPVRPEDDKRSALDDRQVTKRSAESVPPEPRGLRGHGGERPFSNCQSARSAANWRERQGFPKGTLSRTSPSVFKKTLRQVGSPGETSRQIFVNTLRENGGKRRTCYHFCYQRRPLFRISTLLQSTWRRGESNPCS